MITIQKSKIFTIIALLACLLCIPYVIAGVLETLALVLGIVAAVVTIVGGILWVKGQIENALKNRKKSLAQLQADQTKLEGKIETSRDKGKTIQADIDELEPKVQALKSSEYTAGLAYTEADQVTKKAQAEVNKASKAYKASYKAWKDHVNSCSYCESSSNCNTEYTLASQKDTDWWAWEYAKRRLGIAQTDEEEKAAAWKTEWEKFKKANRKLTKLGRDKTNHTEAHGELLEEQKTLKQRIKDKEESVRDAETDLGIANGLEQGASDYLERLDAARAAGEDMNQWLEDNPPPTDTEVTSLKNKYAH